MQVSPRKKELLNRSGYISSQFFNGYDYLWLLNTSCVNCYIKISCINLTLFNYHSVIFSSVTNPILNDATYKNYSICPDDFYSRTDTKGFYFIYYYHQDLRNVKDRFNFSYIVFDCNDKYRGHVKDIIKICNCVTQNESDNCQIFAPHVSWKNINQTSEDLFASRYMHAMAVVDSNIYVHGGISSKNIDDRLFIRYYQNKWQIMQLNSTNPPPCLYGHYMDYNHIKYELVLFGGIICGFSSTKDDVGTIWIFNLKDHKWIRYTNSISRPVIGHTIHNYQNIMYSFFGITTSTTSRVTVLSVIQKFNLDTRTSMNNISFCSNKSTHGLVFHSSYRNESTIWIYGGLFVNYSTGISVNNILYMFNLVTNKCDRIEQLGPKLFLHTSLIINNIFIVIGGIILSENANNEPHSKFSTIIYQFNRLKNNWMSSDQEFCNIGEKSFLEKNNTISIVGGKCSSFQHSLTEIKFVEKSFKVWKSKMKILFIPTPLDLLSTHNCNQLNCESCVREECVWCALTKNCISRLQLAIFYMISACDSPILFEYQCPVKCEDLSNSGCQNCTKLQFCGWCEFRNEYSGIGKCTEGTVYGPDFHTNSNQVQKYCVNNPNKTNWSFLPSRCSTCNCNGHAKCTKTSVKYSNKSLSKCSLCKHNTIGDQCQECKVGYQGSAINGNKCYPCICVKDISHSHNQCSPNGICDEVCIEKGRIGKHCNDCDRDNNFTKFYDMCVYKCRTNEKCKFNEKTNLFQSYMYRIRILLSDVNSNIDLGFRIRCFNRYKTNVKVEMFNESGDKTILIPDINCSFFEKNFPKALFQGKLPYQFLFTVSGFPNSSFTQLQLEFMFTQKPYTNLPFILISLFACLFTALLLFYTVFKMRQHRNRNYQRLMVMERPFAKINLKIVSDLEKNLCPVEFNALLETSNYDECSQLSTTHQCPLVCVEPYSHKDNKLHGTIDEFKRNSVTSVVTFLFQSPKCTSYTSTQQSQNFHYKHSSRILIGSVLTKLTKKDRKLLLELPTKSSSGNNLMVERDFDTSISPSAAEELLITDV